ncbi:MAG: hypothetical protein HFJ17_04035 [Clostridia bacterium]|nr:hypothetical protein [Clostridia bacterium]
MKVLFAVQDEQVSTKIVREYQKKYKEIISYKNIYYFTAILKELQRDKTYDRIVIDEELEEFNGTSYEQKDKFIFDKLDNISDEASNANGKDIPIILICSERRSKSEDIFVKLFGIGIYNAIIGNDRSTGEVCRLIQQPRSKKQAKLYYKIDTEEVNYRPENENDVSEEEMQNILMHFKKLGKNEDQFVDSFRRIVKQYNKEQLKVIISVLPLNVKAVLEEQSTEYQRIVSVNGRKAPNREVKPQGSGTVEKLLGTNDNKSKITKPVVVPSIMKNNTVKKLTVKKPVQPIDTDIFEDVEEFEEMNVPEVEVPEVEEPKVQVEEPKPVKRGRGRPRKVVSQEEISDTQSKEDKPVKRGRGRPRKVVPQEIEEIQPQNIVEEKNELPMFDDETDEELSPLPGFTDIEDDNEEDVQLPGFDSEEEYDDELETLPGFDDLEDEDDTEPQLPGFDEEEYDDEVETLPGFDDLEDEDDTEPKLPGFNDEEYDDEVDTLPGFDDEEDEELSPLPGFDDTEDEEENENQLSGFSDEEEYDDEPNIVSRPIMREEKKIEPIQQNNYEYDDSDFDNLLSADRKIVTFVGTSKNGTSFLVNNVAHYLSMNGIDTAILDTTQNKNAYYIYTKNEEDLRNTAAKSIPGLLEDRVDGIQVNPNLTVYTAVPGHNVGIENAGKILETLLKNHSAILIDCDFDTPYEYFNKAQEIYLVQSMDVLTIQPLTAFLRELQSKEILKPNKIRILLNKVMRLKEVSAKHIIGGMSFYNDPEMSYMKELFDRETVKYIQVPFDEEVYAQYLDGIVECEITTNKYPKSFQPVLREVANMVYPLLPGKVKNKKEEKTKPGYDYSSGFSSSVNNTLNNMKRRY